MELDDSRWKKVQSLDSILYSLTLNHYLFILFIYLLVIYYTFSLHMPYLALFSVLVLQKKTQWKILSWNSGDKSVNNSRLQTQRESRVWVSTCVCVTVSLCGVCVCIYMGAFMVLMCLQMCLAVVVVVVVPCCCVFHFQLQWDWCNLNVPPSPRYVAFSSVPTPATLALPFSPCCHLAYPGPTLRMHPLGIR